ncbi:MAG: nitrate reductase associated protein, partial [Candidatus Binatus sp.]
MIRKFKFEEAMHESLQCVPMAVRRKLDRVGLKIGLEQWKSLGGGERLAICHFPIDSAEECDGLGLFIREAIKRRFGVEPKSLTDAQRASAEPPASPPA